MKAINLPAYMYKEENNGNTKYYAGLERHRPAISVLAYSEKEVREKLVADVNEHLSIATEIVKNDDRYIIGTGSGDVFVISFNRRCWEYSICGIGRKYGSATVSNWSFLEAKEAAIRHAKDCFGGVVWEHSF